MRLNVKDSKARARIWKADPCEPEMIRRPWQVIEELVASGDHPIFDCPVAYSNYLAKSHLRCRSPIVDAEYTLEFNIAPSRVAKRWLSIVAPDGVFAARGLYDLVVRSRSDVDRLFRRGPYSNRAYEFFSLNVAYAAGHYALTRGIGMRRSKFAATTPVLIVARISAAWQAGFGSDTESHPLIEAEIYAKPQCWECVERVFVASVDNLDFPTASNADLVDYCLKYRIDVRVAMEHTKLLVPLHSNVNLTGADRVISAKRITSIESFYDAKKVTMPNFTWYEAYRA